MVIPKGQGPFMSQTDTILLELRGSRELDIEVVPYYLINDVTFSSSNGDVSANFSVEKIINDANAKDIEWVGLFVNPTQFASAGTNENEHEAKIAGGAIADPTSIDLTADVKQLVPAQNYVYATIGLKIAGVEDLIYSPVQKVTF